MKKTFLAYALMALSSTAFAGGFDGAYVDLGIGAAYNDLYQFNHGGSDPMPDINGTHVMGQVKAGYAFDISPGFTVGANVFYTVGDSSDSVIYVNKDSSTVTSKYKNTWGVSFEPGFNLNENLLVYGKLGYVRSDLSISVVNNANIGTASATLNGVLYGAGAKYLIDKDIYIGAEVAQYDYGSNSEILTLKGDPNILNHKNQQTVGVLSVGYYF